MIFGFVMGFRVRSMQSQYQMRKELKEDDVNYKTTYNLLSKRDYQKIKELLLFFLTVQGRVRNIGCHKKINDFPIV